MSVLEVIRRMYVYTRWADERVLDAADGLSPDKLLEAAPVAGGSLHAGLWHLITARVGWLTICRGRDAWSEVLVSDSTSIAGLREVSHASHEMWQEFLESLSEEQAVEPIELPMDRGYRQSAGEPLLRWAGEHGGRPRRPLWQSIMHVVNHSTQHRGEIGMYLGTLERSPGDLDYGTFEEYRAMGVSPGRLES